MNILLLAFAIPVATVLLAIVLQKYYNNIKFLLQKLDIIVFFAFLLYN